MALVAAGEESGTLPEMLAVIGDFPEDALANGDVRLVILTTLPPLLEAGFPLLRALKVLERACEGEGRQRAAEIVGDLWKQIQTGHTFSEALEQHSGLFGAAMINVVKAGELGGVLEIVMRRLHGWVVADYRRAGFAS